MNNTLPLTNAKKEVARIIKFIQNTLQKQDAKNVILAASGGTDSTTCLYLLAQAMPGKNIFVIHLPYHKSVFAKLQQLATNLGIPKGNLFEISIGTIVGTIATMSDLVSRSDLNKVRLGNIIARTRMIVLYDLAKKQRALVCGTENKTEYYLGYFTRFGDEASDFEPIRHLYKTQVYQLAKHLGLPQEIITQSPTAGLWEGQTDEGEFGFSYAEADQVLYFYFDKKLSVKEIQKKGFRNAKKVIEWVKKKDYKHNTPYVIDK